MNFWDDLGRLHNQPVTEQNPLPCNNAYIYTAYHKVLYPELNHGFVLIPSTTPFSRHPTELKQTQPISHDEITGVCILSKRKAKDICDYLKKNHNQFCDLPDFQPRSLFKLNWFKVVKAFYNLNKTENPRRAVRNFPDTWNVAFYQRPEYRWMYKHCAGITPTLFERIYFTLARIVSIIKWKKEDPNLLLFFSLKHLKQQDNLGIEGQLIQMYLNTVVGDMYEDIDDMFKYATKDLPSEYYDVHPFING